MLVSVSHAARPQVLADRRGTQHGLLKEAGGQVILTDVTLSDLHYTTIIDKIINNAKQGYYYGLYGE